MTPARLDPSEHAWLGDPASARVLDALDAAAPAGTRFVGGCVRNAVMGRPVDDVDLATVLEPPAVCAALEAAGVKVALTGLDHGTVTAVSDGRPFEITTLREDVETTGRRAVVAFTTDWEADSRRRDFRLNAIYAGRDGELYDPQGGVADAQKGRIVFIGAPEDRIREDYLRILRFYRFNAWYADGPADPAGQAACAALRSGLTALSVERVWKELKKLLSAPDPSRALRAMQESHVLEILLPGRLDLKRLLSLVKCDEMRAREPDALVRLAAVRDFGGDDVREFQDSMRLSKAEAARLGAIAEAALSPQDLSDARARRRTFYKHGPLASADRARLLEADGVLSGEAVDRTLEEASAYARPVLPVKAKDLITRGFAPGPALGAALAALEADWAASDFTLTREALLDRLRAAGGAA